MIATISAPLVVAAAFVMAGCILMMRLLGRHAVKHPGHAFWGNMTSVGLLAVAFSSTISICIVLFSIAIIDRILPLWETLAFFGGANAAGFLLLRFLLKDRNGGADTLPTGSAA